MYFFGDIREGIYITREENYINYHITSLVIYNIYIYINFVFIDHVYQLFNESKKIHFYL